MLLHRDPVVLCASVCSLIHTLSGTFTDADHRAYIAEHWVAMLEESIRRIDAFRAAHPEHPIVDVAYDDLVRDPVGAVASIYAAFGDAAADGLDRRARDAMAAYVAAHPEEQPGCARLRPRRVRPRRRRSSPSASPATSTATTCRAEPAAR